MVGTALFASGAATAVRAALSDAMSVVGRYIAKVPPALRAVTARRAVPTTIQLSLRKMFRQQFARLFDAVDDSFREF
jgi:hypothetical protein